MATETSLSLTNWCGTHELATLDQLAQPESEPEVRAVLAQTGPAGKVQITGSRHSWPELITAPGATALNTEKMSRIHQVGDDRIDVDGGAALAEIHDAIRAVGQRLDYYPPVIASQTVAGAMATGTHGQGMGQSTIGDAARSIRLVDAGGEAHECHEEDDDFGALRLHLGCLGVLTRVTLATVPNLACTCEKLVVNHRDFLDRFDRWNREYSSCKAWWFPDHDTVHVWLTRPATPGETERLEENGGQLVWWGGESSELNEVVDTAIERMRVDTKTHDLQRDQFKTVLRFKDFGNVTGDITDLLCQGIPVAQINCEVGVPLAAVPQVQAELTALYGTGQHQLHYPIIMRPTGPSDAWLSPGYKRDTCYYGFVIYRAEDGSFPANSFTHLNESQEILAGAGGMPHWGKYFNPERFDFSQFERWEDFKRIRHRYDPGRRFLGPFLEAIIGS